MCTRMKKLHLTTTVLVAFAAVGSAAAADLPAAPVYKAPLLAPTPAYDWTGLYIGGHFGAGWSEVQDTALTVFPSSAVFPVGTPFSQLNKSGFLGGVQAGFNWRISNWVIGVEGDYSWADLTGSESTRSPVAPAISDTTNGKTSDLALATGRLGYAWNNWLFYLKGGGAWAQASATSQSFSGSTVVATSSSSVDRSGWTVGGGIEWGFWGNWSAKIEYNHIDFGTQQVTVVGLSGVIAGQSALRNSTARPDLVKAGLNYRFNWGSPVVAKY
jgi:outer membrane immunogenic protein